MKQWMRDLWRRMRGAAEQEAGRAAAEALAREIDRRTGYTPPPANTTTTPPKEAPR